jgi:DNA-binding HxlR family transcriptional regulator/putative sterol carrier protein
MRSYRQFCPAARALEIVGERWTLLVIRELLVGPKRYTDLQEELPGIGPNVLAERLRTLESAGVVRRRRLPRPAAATVYELTELGAGLRSVLLDLFQWGLQLLGTPTGEEIVKVSYWLPAIEAAARSAVAPADLNEVYEFCVDDESITIAASDGEIQVADGPAMSPDLVVRTDAATFAQLGRGHISPQEANDGGKLTFEGDVAAAERCAAMFATVGLQTRGQAAA